MLKNVIFKMEIDKAELMQEKAFYRKVPLSVIYRVLSEKFLNGEVEITDEDLSQDSIKWGRPTEEV